MERRYTISDAAKRVNVEAHVLRYWEEELGLKIPRNSQGHRYYLEEQINQLLRIQELKEQGFQLRAIKLLLPDLMRVSRLSGQELYQLREELNAKVQEESIQSNPKIKPLPLDPKKEKYMKFEEMLENMIEKVLSQAQSESEQRISDSVSEKLLKELDYRFREREELQEKQLHILEQILGRMSSVKSEVAASQEPEITTLQSKRRSETKNNSHKLRLRFLER